jgi:sigma-B regulation protein RsbU (phosphoserine phosphatase)
MKGKSTAALYVLLVFLAIISMGYYVAGALALREEFFHSAQYARSPFQTLDDAQTVTASRQEGLKAGLSDGDVLISIDGVPYTGYVQLEDLLRRTKPGDTWRVEVRTPAGRVKRVDVRLASREGPDFGLGGLIALLAPVLGVPLLGLIVAYWIIAARPHDLNAWLVFVLLAFPESAFGNLDWSFWPNPWYIIFGLWNEFIQFFTVVALLWFGIYFPERWRADRRWPWFKWLILGLTFCTFAFTLTLQVQRQFDVRRVRPLLRLEAWSDQINGWIWALCCVLFLVALFDKLRSASTSDARRRLRVLAIGSGLSLAPLLIIFAILPKFGIDPHHGKWFTAIVVPIVALFPLTLAYVLIVQRAMDVRILLRIGTKYLLARATLLSLEIGVAAFVILRFIVPTIERKQHEVVNLILLFLLIGILVRVFVVRDSISNRLQRWLDRKFFREAYSTEVVLSELSSQVRQFAEKGPLLDTVLRRISEILHVPQIAVWLRGSHAFHLQQAVGIDLMNPVMLPESSATVQNLVQTNRPATVYADRPEEWFSETEPEEREALQRVNAELLLPLPGRERLMGLMALGPKQSEQPYTPTDLRILQSVAAQTGLALEVSELAASLAQEAAQRERINREIEIAREVQQRLFPQRLPDIPGVSLAGMCRPALGVGGDYYDVIELEDGRLGLAVGDVSGKGISAALLMASLRASLRGVTLDAPDDLARMMQKVNRLVYEASANNRYATFFFATYDPRTGELRYVNAGHNAPMLVRRVTGDVLRLEAGGLVVGLLPFASYEAQSVPLQPGDLFIAYTDGISEAMTADDEEWGEERMLASVQASSCASATDVLDSIFAAADLFTSGAEQHDDMTLLIMKLTDC